MSIFSPLMLPSIQQFSKIVKNFFQVGHEGEWFGQVSFNTLLPLGVFKWFTCGGAPGRRL